MASEIIRKYMQARRADGKSEVAPQQDAPHAKGMEVPGILSKYNAVAPVKPLTAKTELNREEACDKVGIPRPKLTYIIITKVGLATRQAEYEFYLQSHTPMRYNVIVDQNNFLPDE
ncbi:hypothetical protein FRB90_000908 [Tulasnella sp. 427]|nr:hypothetical protein FRB90_000908 [Tulasnella sp. 427]